MLRYVEEFLISEHIQFQLGPAGLHWRNTAEVAVRIFKDHFITGLCTINPKYPLTLWDRLLPLAAITLNLLRPSRINPRLSAYA